MVTFTGINHLAMVTADMDATIRFWRDLLGFRLVVGLGKPGYRHYFFEISQHDMIAFFEWPDLEGCPEKDHGVPVKGPACFDHVSFEVATDDDLWELKDRIEAADIWISEVVDHGFIKSIYAFDPNGIAIEFSTPIPEGNIRKTPVMADRSPTQLAREGAEPVAGRWPEPQEWTALKDREVYEGEGDMIRDILREKATS